MAGEEERQGAWARGSGKGGSRQQLAGALAPGESQAAVPAGTERAQSAPGKLGHTSQLCIPVSRALQFCSDQSVQSSCMTHFFKSRNSPIMVLMVVVVLMINVDGMCENESECVCVCVSVHAYVCVLCVCGLWNYEFFHHPCMFSHTVIMSPVWGFAAAFLWVIALFVIVLQVFVWIFSTGKSIGVHLALWTCIIVCAVLYALCTIFVIYSSICALVLPSAALKCPESVGSFCLLGHSSYESLMIFIRGCELILNWKLLLFSLCLFLSLFNIRRVCCTAPVFSLDQK